MPWPDPSAQPAEPLQNLPGPGRQLEVEARRRVGQVTSGDVANPLQAVLERVAVHTQSVAGGGVVASALQVLKEGLDEVRVLLQVVVEQGTQLGGHEALDTGE